MKKLIMIAAVAAFAATPAMADLSAELSVGQTHAGMAAKQADIKMVHTHLQHALNCLVGPSGAGFDAAPGNPCAKAGGNGAITDATNAAQKAKLETAAASAKSGIASNDLATAQKDAQATADAIGGAK